MTDFLGFERGKQNIRLMFAGLPNERKEFIVNVQDCFPVVPKKEHEQIVNDLVLKGLHWKTSFERAEQSFAEKQAQLDLVIKNADAVIYSSHEKLAEKEEILKANRRRKKNEEM